VYPSRQRLAILGGLRLPARKVGLCGSEVDQDTGAFVGWLGGVLIAFGCGHYITCSGFKPMRATSSALLNCSGSLMLAKFLQFKNALSPMVVTLSGISTMVNPVQSQNDQGLISTTVLGILIEVIC